MNSHSLALLQSQEIMKRSPYFRGWDAERLSRLAAGAHESIYAKGESLIRKGEVIKALQVVIIGQVRIFIPLSNGSERVIVLLGRGESFGEACLIEKEPSPYQAVASSACRLLSIDGAVLLKEMRQDAILCNRILSVVAKRMLGMLNDTEMCAQRSSVQRVACYLMRQRPDDGARSFNIELPARKRDIAAKMGLTPETFSRVLASLRQKGAIQVDGRRIQVEDSTVLASLVPDSMSSRTLST